MLPSRYTVLSEDQLLGLTYMQLRHYVEQQSIEHISEKVYKHFLALDRQYREMQHSIYNTKSKKKLTKKGSVTNLLLVIEDSWLINIEQIAAIVGISRGVAYKWYKGVAQPNARHLELLFLMYKLGSIELYSIEESRKYLHKFYRALSPLRKDFVENQFLEHIRYLYLLNNRDFIFNFMQIGKKLPQKAQEYFLKHIQNAPILWITNVHVQRMVQQKIVPRAALLHYILRSHIALSGAPDIDIAELSSIHIPIYLPDMAECDSIYRQLSTARLNILGELEDTQERSPLELVELQRREQELDVLSSRINDIYENRENTTKQEDELDLEQLLEFIE